MKAADQVWLAVAALERASGSASGFSASEIIEWIEESGCGSARRDTIRAHVSSHNLATAKPSPDRFRMLTRTSRGRVRLYRPGDPYHPDRAAGATAPESDTLPAEYRDLVDWYKGGRRTEDHAEADSLLRLAAFMRSTGVWRGIEPDAYVAELRAGWD